VSYETYTKRGFPGFACFDVVHTNVCINVALMNNFEILAKLMLLIKMDKQMLISIDKKLQFGVT